MDITGGTTNSGGIFSPNTKLKKFGFQSVVYDPHIHRWAKNTNFHPCQTPKQNMAINSHRAQSISNTPKDPSFIRYTNVRDHNFIKFTKYLIQILREICKPELMQKLQSWTVRISDDSKKGLRVIHKIMEVEGKKRFKLDHQHKE